MLKRTLVVLVLLPIGLFLILLGGWAFAALITLVLGLAGWEYCQVFRVGGLKPAAAIVIGGIILFSLGRAQNGFESSPVVLSLVILAAMAYHLVAFERGSDQAGTDFGVTLGGALYLGWIGAYLISVRDLPDGQWWLLLILPAVWFADSAAYIVGSRIGKHKMAPRLSPKKSWEGYIAGVVFGTLGTALLAMLFRSYLGPDTAITPWMGLLLGFVLSTLTTLGDLGESMIKRQVGVKDTGHLLPGHGGAFDRIDSWLWAAVLGYYLVIWLVYS
jgi:phosphatidate cytidylyltransferase